MIKSYKKSIIFILLVFSSFHVFSQFVIVNITWINTDKPLLGVLTQKLAVNAVILSQQTLIHTGLKDIQKSKVETRVKEYEKNKYDRSLKAPLALNLVTNNLLLLPLITTKDNFPFYITAAKNEYFIRELAINNTIALQIALTRNNNIRNANTQKLYSLDRKLLTKLNRTNKNVHKNAVFVIVASLLAKASKMSNEDFEKIMRLGL
jgi:hypothetical protein